MMRFVLSLIGFFIQSQALAVPEIAYFGHFTCVSCHVSPGGSGVLTSYGRTFSAEKLSTWSFDGEENPLHGLLPMSDRYLFGGDARWVDYRTRRGETDRNTFWRMQTDLEAGLHLGPAWFTIASGTKPAGPYDSPKDHTNPIIRTYAGRLDLWDEHLMIRAGLFTPKYGLMLADHTAFIRTYTGLGPDTEQTQCEVIYQDDLYEITFAGLFPSDAFSRQDQTQSGINAGVALFLQGQHRVNANILYTQKEDTALTTTKAVFGLSAVTTLSKRLFAMGEWDHILTERVLSEGKTSSQDSVGFFQISWKTFKGFFPYARAEAALTEQNHQSTATRRWGAGINWYTRPHLQWDARILQRALSGISGSQTEAMLLLHYYL